MLDRRSKLEAMGHSLNAKLLNLQIELDRMKAREPEIQTELHATYGALTRLSEIDTAGLSEGECPLCWVKDQVRVSLTAAVFDDGPHRPHENLMRCPRCRDETMLDYSRDVASGGFR